MNQTIKRAVFGIGLLGALLLPAGCLSEDVIRTVSVFDAQGQPIEGASVALEGRMGVGRALTRADGSARLGAEDAGIALVVSRPGYKLTQIPYTTNQVIRVVLEQE